jgi:hypothetical protein
VVDAIDLSAGSQGGNEAAYPSVPQKPGTNITLSPACTDQPAETASGVAPVCERHESR